MLVLITIILPLSPNKRYEYIPWISIISDLISIYHHLSPIFYDELFELSFNLPLSPNQKIPYWRLKWRRWDPPASALSGSSWSPSFPRPRNVLQGVESWETTISRATMVINLLQYGWTKRWHGMSFWKSLGLKDGAASSASWRQVHTTWNVLVIPWS